MAKIGRAYRADPSNIPLKRWLRETGTTQTQLAHDLTVCRGAVTAQSQVSAWVTGKTNPSGAMLVVIEKVTGIARDQWPCWRARQRKRQARESMSPKSRRRVGVG